MDFTLREIGARGRRSWAHCSAGGGKTQAVGSARFVAVPGCVGTGAHVSMMTVFVSTISDISVVSIE
jgi:N-acetyl-gamma-glutamylphosphate reductase